MKTRIPREIEIQNYVRDVLSEYFNIYPFSVLYTECYGSPRLSVALFGSGDLQELLEIIGYKQRCDKTGYTVFYDKNTLLFYEKAKDHFFNILRDAIKK